ncbi:MAG: ATP-binding protein, partial [Candidatus Omnitrophica bacterium]|nr:ATP-binding protein [Candidatus Omnitrophota bacterium]
TREACQINELVRRAVELIRPRAPRVQFIEQLDDSIPTIVTGVSEIERALFNLLLNAVDAVESVQHSPTIHIQTARENSAIAVRIKDNGCGIRREDLPHIFEPFFTTKTVGKGTGLGLYISYNAIRDLGGRLEIENDPGAGARAAIVLPINHE